MIQISQIKSAASAASIGLKGRVVYSSSIAANRPTILDAFKTQLLKPQNVNRHISSIRKEALKYLETSEQIVKQELEKEGLKVFVLRKFPNETAAQYQKRLEAAKDADIFISARVKGDKSNYAKMKREINRMQHFDENLDAKTLEKAKESKKMINYFLSDSPQREKYKNLVNDELGFRLTMNRESINGEKVSDKILKAFSSLHKKEQIKFKKFENYHGENIEPYINESQVYNHFNIANTKNPPEYAILPKPFGYTRVNADANIGGVNVEAQFGGKHTVPLGDVEHVLYDKRSGKVLDITHLTPEQVKHAKSIRTAYGKVLGNKQKDVIYNEYMPKMWENARIAEKTGNPFMSPKVPEGIDPILSAESLLKLTHKN